MDRFSRRRFAALLLGLLLAAACVLPAAAAPPVSVSFTEVSPPADAAPPPYHQLVSRGSDINALAVNDEPLRVIIELEKPSLMEKGYSAADLAADGDAAAYNRELWQDQDAVIKAIEAATGEPLDVVWRLTIIANLLSARVLPEQMEIIAAVPGVRSVQEEAVAVPLEADGEDAESTAPGDAADAPGDGSEADAAETDTPETADENSHDAAPDDAAAGGEPTTAEAGSGTPVAEDAGDGTVVDEALPAAQADEPAGPAGYNGAGQRIAILDTGTDEWHRSLNSGAWMYALAQNAKAADKTLEAYVSTLDLLDEAGIAAVLPDLTIVQRSFERSVYDPTDPDYGSAEAVQKRAEIAKGLAGHGEAVTVDGHSLHKIAFGANYSTLGTSYDITHGRRSEHGSHVAGIAAANRYVPAMKCWDPATGKLTTDTPEYELLPTVTVQKEGSAETKTASVRGQAPDAQLLVMQVFGMDEYFLSEGTSESDYLAAVQDALVLGADAVNLSLGSREPGATFAISSTFQSVINRLIDSGAVVAAAHGNSYHWTWPKLPTETYPAELPALPYADDVVFDTGGTPSTFDTFLAVAAADTNGEAPRMAGYSSWGVPSSLELKPEITAPGTDIDSLNGAHGDPEEGADVRHDEYEEMTGTSMATPQIAGMAALVTEYLKAKHPDLAADAADRRHIAQSLLMSTAMPMKYPDDPGTYYSVLWQGAGLADAGKAVSTDAYITMGTDAVFRTRTADDGKVKAELGANMDGKFRFTFTVHDLDTEASHTYKVHTDLFTQGLTTYMGAASLDTKTVLLPGTVSYTSTGGSPDGDGISITVPENGSVEVTVDIQINALDPAQCPAGAFVE